MNKIVLLLFLISYAFTSDIRIKEDSDSYLFLDEAATIVRSSISVHKSVTPGSAFLSYLQYSLVNKNDDKATVTEYFYCGIDEGRANIYKYTMHGECYYFKVPIVDRVVIIHVPRSGLILTFVTDESENINYKSYAVSKGK